MRTLLLAFCLFVLVFGDEQQQTCRSCTTNTCSAPWATETLTGTCVNGEWVYNGPISLTGKVSLICAVRVNGAVNFAEGTTLSLGSCGRLGVETFNAPRGVGVEVDLGETTVSIGSSKVFATFRNATGYISSASVSNIGAGSPQFAFYPELANNQASLLFLAPGTPDPTQNSRNIGVSSDPNFNANGDRIRACPRYTCTNPSVCNDPTGGTGRCDSTTGEWIIPNDVNVASANLSCPLRIQGNFRATTSLNIGGCARIRVTGVAVLAGQTDSDRVSISFDLNDFGKPVSGERISWLSADGGIIGGVTISGYNNIWDTTNSVNVINQRCNNGYQLIFYPMNGANPGETCAGAVASNAVTDDFVGDVVQAGDMAVNEGDFVDVVQGDMAVDQGDFAIVDNAPFNEGDLILMDAAVADAQSSASASGNSDAMPAYAVALVVLGVLLIVGLVVIQVQLVLLYRSNTFRRE